MGHGCVSFAKWEKIFYGIVAALFILMFLFAIFGVIAHYAAHPVKTHSVLKKEDPFRYPYVFVCEAEAYGDTNATVVEQALTMPSRISVKALAEYNDWTDESKAAAQSGAKGPAEFLNDATVCPALVKSCFLGGKPVKCCERAVNVITDHGKCVMIDIMDKMDPEARPVADLNIELLPTSDNVHVGVADYQAFYLSNWVSVAKGNAAQFGLESLRYFSIGWEKEKRAMDAEAFKDVGYNVVEYLKGDVWKKCGCKFSYSETGEKYCSTEAKLECAAWVFKAYQEGKWHAPFFRNGQHYYKLFSRGGSAIGRGKIFLNIRYESEYTMSIEEYFEPINSLFWLIGTHFSNYVSHMVVLVVFVQLCKCCCACCRAREDSF